MKRFFLVASLVLALGSFGLAAPVSPLPAGEKYDQMVEFSVNVNGESLPTMVAALARAVGLTAIVDDVPADRVIKYDVAEAKPFRQLWNIVLTLNDLDYVLLDNDVVVIGTPASIARLRTSEPVDETAGISQRFYRVGGDPLDLASVVRQAIPGASVDVLENLSTLSVRGNDEQHARVVILLEQFDSEVARPVRRIYRLSNATATELTEVLQNTVLTADIGAEDADRVVRLEDITITADVRTNSLVVTAPESVQAEIAALVEQLDIAQPQINVQVRIQEINRRAANELGINLTAGIGNFAANILDTGLRFVFDAQNAISGLNIGAVLDTLEAQRLARRVDDSNLTMLNNQTGVMQSGGRIEITFGSAQGEIQQRTIEFGVMISVTPRISADGRVILTVEAEVSDIATPLGSGIPQRIDFTQRKVNSTVTLAPGQTVLLGGLLQNSFSTTTNRTPVLGSIPIIGDLFSSTSTSEENTELLLIVNANIID